MFLLGFDSPSRIQSEAAKIGPRGRLNGRIRYPGDGDIAAIQAMLPLTGTALVVRTIYDSVQTEPAEPGPTLRKVLNGAAFIILAWVALTVLLALLRLLLIPAETWTGGKFGPIVFLLIFGVVTPFTLFIMLHVAVIPARLYKALTDKEPYGFEFVCLRALVLVGVTLVLSWLHLLAK